MGDDSDPILSEWEAELGFRSFYENLEDKREIFYVFFTSGLLHWLDKTLSFVPQGVNVVLLGSALSADELAWLQTHVSRPFHHIPPAIDDKTVWELLFAVNWEDFGWLDVDCLVRNPSLFEEIKPLEADVFLNTLWAFPAGKDALLSYTHFLFVNASVLRDPRIRSTGVTPCTYTYDGSRAGRNAAGVTSRVLTPFLKGIFQRVYGLQKDTYLPGMTFVDTLQMYTLVAEHFGYRVRKVRSLGPRREPSHSSPEVIHVNSISYVTRPDFAWHELSSMERNNFLLVLMADCLLLLDSCAGLPAAYRQEAERRCAKVREVFGVGLSVESMKQILIDRMSTVLDRAAIATDDRWKFIRPAPPQPRVDPARRERVAAGSASVSK